MKESLTPNAQKELLQSRSITLPPVTGMIAEDEFEELEIDPVVEGDVGGTGVGGVGVGVGGVVVSTTVTWKLPNAMLPDASLEKQLTVVVPTAKDEPEAGTQLTEVGPSTASFAEAE